MRERIRACLVEETLPSLAVAVARGGEIVWEEAFGWADRGRRIPATPHTLYSLASISKPITATGLMILRERGLLDLDRPMDDYLGGARLNARAFDASGATVRRIANHTAGLPLHYQFFYADEPYRRPPMDETIRRYGNLVTAPGERYQYSNLGYGLLDYAISRLSGRSYAAFMREEVFLPLGMLRASVDIGPGLEPFAATRYGADGVPYPFYDFDHPGGSAVFCSAHDLLRFAMLHLKTRCEDQRAILAEETIDAMRAPTSHPGEPSGYGIGWSIAADDNGYGSVSHTGGMGGVNTILKLIPDEGIAVAVLANACTGAPARFAEEILDALLPAYSERRARPQPGDQPADVKEEREEEEHEDDVSGEEAIEPDEGEPTGKPAGGLRGRWKGYVDAHRGEVPLTLHFKESGDVHGRFGRQLEALVNEVRFEEGFLSGCMVGDIGTEDASRRPHHLHLDLKLRGKVLNGAVVAVTYLEDAQGGAPGRRMGNALGHWAELRRAGD